MKRVCVLLPNDSGEHSCLITPKYTFAQLARDCSQYAKSTNGSGSLHFEGYPEDEAVLKLVPSSQTAALKKLVLVPKESKAGNLVLCRTNGTKFVERSGDRTPRQPGGLDAKPNESTGVRDLDEELWTIFTTYSFQGDDTEATTAWQFEKLLKDCELVGTSAGLPASQVRIHFTQWASKEGVLRYGPWLNCLVDIAQQLFPYRVNAQDALAELVTEHLMVKCVRLSWRAGLSWTAQTEVLQRSPEAINLLCRFQDPFHTIFSFFANPQVSQLKTHEQNRTWLNWVPFKRFAKGCGFPSSLGISLQELHHLFVGCCGWKGGTGPIFAAEPAALQQQYHTHKLDLNDRCHMHLHGFMEAIARCALMAFLPTQTDNSDSSSSSSSSSSNIGGSMSKSSNYNSSTVSKSDVCLALKCMLQHVQRQFAEGRFERLLNATARDAPHAAGYAQQRQLHGAVHLFRRTYEAMCAEDGGRDYARTLQSSFDRRMAGRGVRSGASGGSPNHGSPFGSGAAGDATERGLVSRSNNNNHSNNNRSSSAGGGGKHRTLEWGTLNRKLDLVKAAQQRAQQPQPWHSPVPIPHPQPLLSPQLCSPAHAHMAHMAHIVSGSPRWQQHAHSPPGGGGNAASSAMAMVPAAAAVTMDITSPASLQFMSMPASDPHSGGRSPLGMGIGMGMGIGAQYTGAGAASPALVAEESSAGDESFGRAFEVYQRQRLAGECAAHYHAANARFEVAYRLAAAATFETGAEAGAGAAAEAEVETATAAGGGLKTPQLQSRSQSTEAEGPQESRSFGDGSARDAALLNHWGASLVHFAKRIMGTPPRPMPPAAPLNARATRVSAGELLCVWERPSDDGGAPITALEIEVRPPPPHGQPSQVGLGDRFVVDNLRGGVDYAFRIRAKNAVGAGEYSPYSAVGLDASPATAAIEGGSGVDHMNHRGRHATVFERHMVNLAQDALMLAHKNFLQALRHVHVRQRLLSRRTKGTKVGSSSPSQADKDKGMATSLEKHEQTTLHNWADCLVYLARVQHVKADAMPPVAPVDWHCEHGWLSTESLLPMYLQYRQPFSADDDNENVITPRRQVSKVAFRMGWMAHGGARKTMRNALKLFNCALSINPQSPTVAYNWVKAQWSLAKLLPQGSDEARKLLEQAAAQARGEDAATAMAAVSMSAAERKALNFAELRRFLHAQLLVRHELFEPNSSAGTGAGAWVDTHREFSFHSVADHQLPQSAQDVRRLLSPNGYNVLVHIFQKFEADGDLVLDIEEINALNAACGQREVTPATMAELLAKFDSTSTATSEAKRPAAANATAKPGISQLGFMQYCVSVAHSSPAKLHGILLKLGLCSEAGKLELHRLRDQGVGRAGPGSGAGAGTGAGAGAGAGVGVGAGAGAGAGAGVGAGSAGGGASAATRATARADSSQSSGSGFFDRVLPSSKGKSQQRERESMQRRYAEDKRDYATEIEPNCKRFADYFVILGRGRLASTLAELKASSSPADWSFEAEVQSRYPAVDRKDTAFPDLLATFCFPDGVNLRQKVAKPTYFEFVLTDQYGCKLYTSCLHFHEKLSPEELYEVLHQHEEEESESESDGRSDSGSEEREPFGSELPAWVQYDKLCRVVDRIQSARNYQYGDAHGGDDRHHHQLVEAEVESEQQWQCYSPTCICIVSHWAFYRTFRTVACQLLRISRSNPPIPIERFVENVMCDVPVPPRGRIAVKFGLADKVCTVSRPPINELPLLDVSMKPLFMSLDTQNILTVFTCLLTEQKIALFSRHLSLLTPVAETLRSLLFPFECQTVYIPVLPKAMYEYLFAPVPFLMGLHSDYHKSHYMVEGVVFVDLDNNKVSMLPQEHLKLTVPRLPEKEKNKLLSKLRKYGNLFDKDDRVRSQNLARTTLAFGGNSSAAPMTAPSHVRDFGLEGGVLLEGNDSNRHRRAESDMDGTTDFDTNEVRQAFLRFHVKVFQHYRKHLRERPKGHPRGEKGPRQPASEVWFDKKSFINENPPFRELCETLFETQLFERFIEDRVDKKRCNIPQVRFFDESITAKINRSKYGGKRGETPLLDDQTQQLVQTYAAPTPRIEGVYRKGTYAYTHFPRLNQEYFSSMREAKQFCHALSDNLITRQLVKEPSIHVFQTISGRD